MLSPHCTVKLVTSVIWLAAVGQAETLYHSVTLDLQEDPEGHPEILSDLLDPCK